MGMRGAASSVMRLEAGLISLAWLVVAVTGHGIMLHPPSRNWLAYLGGQEYCPHCLNAGGVREVSDHGSLTYPRGRHGMCGDKWSEVKWDTAGPVKSVYTMGQVMTVDFVITENHLGRVDLVICDLDAEEHQRSKCHKLQRADKASSYWYLPFLSNWTGGNSGFESPAYGDGSFNWYRLPELGKAEGCAGDACNQFSGMIVYRTVWQLPRAYNCTQCKLQWHYLSAQNCWPTCPEANRDEPTCENVQVYGVCGAPGTAYPESFWGCADVRVVDSHSGPGRVARAAAKRSHLPPYEHKIHLQSGLFGEPRAYRMGPPFSIVQGQQSASEKMQGHSESHDEGTVTGAATAQNVTVLAAVVDGDAAAPLDPKVVLAAAGSEEPDGPAAVIEAATGSSGAGPDIASAAADSHNMERTMMAAVTAAPAVGSAAGKQHQRLLHRRLLSLLGW